MATAFWHYPSTSTRPAWPKDSKTVLGYDFGYVTDLVDTKNGKNRFLSLEDSNLNFVIWIFLSRSQFSMTFRVDGVSPSYSQWQRSCYCDRRLKKITVAVSVLCFCSLRQRFFGTEYRSTLRIGLQLWGSVVGCLCLRVSLYYSVSTTVC